MAIDSKLYFHATMFASWRAGNANESRARLERPPRDDSMTPEGVQPPLIWRDLPQLWRFMNVTARIETLCSSPGKDSLPTTLIQRKPDNGT
jgi:hypothetical protein